jgi:hypothetical protein
LCKHCEDVRFNKPSGDKGSNNNKSPVFHALLAYAAMYIGSNSYEQIKRAIIGHFEVSEILDAKEVLWSVADLPVRSRRDSFNRSEEEAHVVDILNALLKLDKAAKMPYFCVDYITLSSLPKSQPEELISISVCDRMNKIESNMLNITGMIEKLVIENKELKDCIHTCTVKDKSYAQVASHSIPQYQQGKSHSSKCC